MRWAWERDRRNSGRLLPVEGGRGSAWGADRCAGVQVWATSAGVALVLSVVAVAAVFSAGGGSSATVLQAAPAAAPTYDYEAMQREIKELGQKEANEISKRGSAMAKSLIAAEKNPAAKKQLAWKVAKEAYEKAAFQDIQQQDAEKYSVNNP